MPHLSYADQRGLTLVEMLVVLAIVAILATVVTVPNLDLTGRRAEAAAERLELALAEVLRSSRAGEEWRIYWHPDGLRFRRFNLTGENHLILPTGASIHALWVDGTSWPSGKIIALQGAASPLLRLDIEIGDRQRVLRSLPTGRVERFDATLQ